MEKCTITITDGVNKAVINLTEENDSIKLRVNNDEIVESDEPSLVAWALVTFIESLTK